MGVVRMSFVGGVKGLGSLMVLPAGVSGTATAAPAHFKSFLSAVAIVYPQLRCHSHFCGFDVVGGIF